MMENGSNPSISVVIPLYNGAQYIRRSVESVLAQTYDDFELIVVDDGSADRGGDIVLEFTDPRVRLVQQENAGVSAARNKGIAEGRGKYIAFLDADDAWDAGFLDAVVNLTTLYPQAGIYGTGYRMVYSKGPVVEVTAEEAINQDRHLLITDYLYRANGGSLINASGIMIPRRIFKELGDFKVGEHHGEDLEMWARIALRYPIGYDTRVLFSFYQTGMIKKKRFHKLPKYEPHVRMLQAFLNNTPDSLVTQKIIRAHIKDQYLKSCFWFISNSSRAATLVFMKDNHAEVWAPLLNKLIKIKTLWPLMRFVAWINRVLKSRLVMKFLGGKYVSHGVLQRIRDSGFRFV